MDRYHNLPVPLPGNRGLLFTRRAVTATDDRTVARHLDSGEERVVGPAGAFFSSGLLVYAQGESLFAEAFDPERFESLGERIPLGVAAIRTEGGRSRAFVANTHGTLLALTQGVLSSSQFMWFDRDGARRASLAPENVLGAFDMTPDGGRIVFNLSPATGDSSLWTIDASRGAVARLTFGEQNDVDPNVTADGRVLFARRGGAQPGLYEIPLDGGVERRIRDVAAFSLDDVADDGGAFIYRQSAAPPEAWLGSTVSNEDSLVLRMQTAVDQIHLSPDGRWVAFNNADSGRQEVYIAPREMSGARWQVSVNGGVQPIWRGDGKELFYLDLDGTLQASAIGTTDRAVIAGKPQALFKTPNDDVSAGVEQYRATADGRRFLLRVPVGDQRPPPLRVVLNWLGLIRN